MNHRKLTGSLANGFKHGLSKTALYITCSSMKRRCIVATDPAFPNYGGRGIRFNFSNQSEAVKWILDNLGPKPSPKFSIDRINNNGHYEPGNLRWATRSMQTKNQRPVSRVEKHSYRELVLEIEKRMLEIGMKKIRMFHDAIETLKLGCQ
jgi:hypothetical protein